MWSFWPRGNLVSFLSFFLSTFLPEIPIFNCIEQCMSLIENVLSCPPSYSSSLCCSYYVAVAPLPACDRIDDCKRCKRSSHVFNVGTTNKLHIVIIEQLLDCHSIHSLWITISCYCFDQVAWDSIGQAGPKANINTALWSTNNKVILVSLQSFHISRSVRLHASLRLFMTGHNEMGQSNRMIVCIFVLSSGLHLSDAICNSPAISLCHVYSICETRIHSVSSWQTTLC